MQTLSQQQLIERLYRHIQDGSTDMADAVYRLPVSIYTAADRHREELRTLFQTRPQAVAFAQELTEPGSFITTRAGQLPLILVRDDDARLHALVNICRHRGAKVVAAERGAARMFSCPFHAWCYALDGTLTSIPGAAGFAGIDARQRGLVRLAAEQRHGLIWVHPRPHPAGRVDIAAYLGQELDRELSHFQLDRYRLFRATHSTVAANWKLTMDGFLESYHIRSLHRSSIAPHFYTNLNTVDAFGEHLRLALPKKRIDRMFERPREHWSALSDTTIIYLLFPNTIFVWQTSHVEVYWMQPDAADPGRCRIRLGMLVPEQRAQEADLWERNWQRATGTVYAEDFPQAEQVQAGLEAGIQEELLIGRNELGMQRFYQAVEAALLDV